MMSTGENEQALRKIIDMTRMLSLVVLVFHLYHYGHTVLYSSGYTHTFVDRFFITIAATGLFGSIWNTLLISFLLLIVSLIGVTSKKDTSIRFTFPAVLFATGTLSVLLSHC